MACNQWSIDSLLENHFSNEGMNPSQQLCFEDDSLYVDMAEANSNNYGIFEQVKKFESKPLHDWDGNVSQILK